MSVLPALLGILLFLIGPAEAAKRANVIARVSVNDSFVEQRLTWLGYARPGFVLRWRTYASRGEIVVCGAVAYGSARTLDVSTGVLQRAYITFDGGRILRDLTFFTQVARAGNLSHARASCAATGVSAPKGPYSVRLGWDRGLVGGPVEAR